MKGFLRIVCIVTVVAATVVSCTTVGAPGEFQETRLVGMVYDSENAPVSGADIVLDGVRTTESSVDGRFVFDSVSRGEHALEASRSGMERVSLDFELVDRSQVLYLQMTTLYSLIESARESMRTRDDRSAENYLKRALKVEPENIEAQYLYALVYYRTGRYEEAEQTLASIRARQPDMGVVLLLLADIYQFGHNDTDTALRYLEMYRKASRSVQRPSVEERLEVLGGEVENEQE